MNKRKQEKSTKHLSYFVKQSLLVLQILRALKKRLNTQMYVNEIYFHIKKKTRNKRKTKNQTKSRASQSGTLWNNTKRQEEEKDGEIKYCGNLR